MSSLAEQRRESRLDIEEIDHEPRHGIDRAFEPQFDAVGMAVHAPAAMRGRHVRQHMRRFEGECLCDFHSVLASHP